MPVVVVRQRIQELSIMIRSKAFLGGLLSSLSNLRAQPWIGGGNCQVGVW
ncbi:hypothetical protein Fmac_026683 [Flemingia macrophylla]|uniref:Uncharacterized protein n=1 Tax=Flemingia macrophylla TaxID=520843 RepID=A0ABD1LFJ7_9FABA